jgi:hypothetical protein
MDRLGQRQLGREVAKMPSCALFVLRGVLLFRGRFSSWNAFCALNALFGAKRIFSYVWYSYLFDDWCSSLAINLHDMKPHLLSGNLMAQV